MTCEQAFIDVYTKFKMHFYREVFGEFRDRESGLTTVETFTAYSPVFTSWGGQIYESALVREAIYAKARHIMKLKFDMQGSAQRSLYNAVKVRPNPWSTCRTPLRSIWTIRISAAILCIWWSSGCRRD